ncbi:MAG: MacB family efflux pump subunit [Rhodopseudomonas sp.]|nr:MacB family efflux pump subunit [Rhodopseudomonas sp.]
MTEPRPPLIELRKLRREYPSGDDTLVVLKDLDLTIEAGEMVAIVGASGSGKSTLMNILGCLDRPTAGQYRIAGRETAALDPDELAALRREHFGFIFQRYHLLPALTALGNVEVPAIYAGMAGDERRQRASALLSRLGMADRLGHHPGQLSGGQQQRVCIARALINGGEIILADEPTGALDTQSGEEVLQILDQLNAEGKTIVTVTHDPAIAARAQRIVEIGDGRIISDRRKTAVRVDKTAPAPVAAVGGWRWQAQLDRFRQAFLMALLAMRANRLRTFLTMLGIIIGIAAVVSVVALGKGAQQRVLSNIASLGTNTLEIFPGASFGDVRSAKVQTLVVSDADALVRQPYAAGVTPTVSTSSTVRYGSLEANVLVNGVGAQYFEVKGTKLAEGRLFGADSVRRLAQEVVIDENTRKTLFDGVAGGAVGKILLVGKVPLRVVGVAAQQQGGFGGSQNLSVYLPYTTVQSRILGTTTLRSITLRVSDDVTPALAEQAVTRFLSQRHGRKDFFILNTDDIRQTITQTAQTLTLLVAAIAVISLVVGGIGVMNIMLVSVVERTAEIGVRMAVGARRSDILQQFLIEAVLVCIVGGSLGIVVSLGLGAAVAMLGSSFAFVYSSTAIVLAFLCSTLVGVVFGFLPARNAARLDPVVALARE